MSANQIQMDPSIQYPDKWTPMEFVCNGGVKCRVGAAPKDPTEFAAFLIKASPILDAVGSSHESILGGENF